MKISFTTTPPPIEDTDRFDQVYPEGLQVDREERARLFSIGLGVWLSVNDRLAGEMYGLPGSMDDEGIPDILPSDFYIGSFTILPEYQKLGLGKALMAYALGVVTVLRLGGTDRLGFCRRISMHATSGGMVSIGKLYGFRNTTIHHNWFDTGRTAMFMYLPL